MIRKLAILFCDNEHHFTPTFPDLAVDPEDLKQLAVTEETIGGLRKRAKEAGWMRFNGADYCPACKEGGI